MIKNIIVATISAALLIIMITSCSKNSPSPKALDIAAQVAGLYTLTSASYAGIPVPVTGSGNSANAVVTEETSTTVEVNISATSALINSGKSQNFDFKNLILKPTTTPGIYSINDAAGTPYGTIGKNSINGTVTYNSQPFTFSGSKAIMESL